MVLGERSTQELTNADDLAQFKREVDQATARVNDPDRTQAEHRAKRADRLTALASRLAGF